MRMVVLLVRSVLHRPIAGHGQLARTDERVTVRTGDIFEIIFGEKPAVDFYPQPVREFGDLDARLFTLRILFGCKRRKNGNAEQRKTDFYKISGKHGPAICFYGPCGSNRKWDDNLVALYPADSTRVGTHEEPVIFMLQHSQFGAVMDDESSLGRIE